MPRSIGSAGAVMAAGTVASRLTGFVRNAVMAATIGLALTGDVFNVPNTIPNSLYILVGGGVLNAVLVPQLVRAIRHDADGGVAYAQRLTTAVVAVLLAATLLFVVAAPWVIRVYVAPQWLQPGFEQQFDAMVAFARYCLPQVFFYGVYVLLGQMLNARGSFGPMMWAPVLNNVVAIAVFGGYLVAYGPLDARSGTYTPGQLAWFGLGSTAGIAVQALVLLPVLHRTGLRLRLRRDLRGVGLAKAARLGGWTVLFVVVNQVTYVVLTRLATGAIAERPDQAAGLSVFNGAILIGQLPHAIITVSLATALLPAMSRAAADRDLARLRSDLVGTTRLTLALVLPAAVLLVPLAVPVAGLVFGYGAAAQDVDQVSVALLTMAPGMVFFAVQFLNLRGFYALEDTRTPFFVQLLAVSPVYIAVGGLLAPRVAFPPAGLTAAYSCAYVVATAVTSRLLGRRLGGRANAGLGGYVLRLLAAAVPAALLAWVIDRLADGVVVALLGPGVLRWLTLCLVAGVPGLAAYVGLAWLLRVDEVGSSVSAVARRLPGRGHRAAPSGPGRHRRG